MISILFAYSANYAQHGAACIASILANTTSELEIVVATTGNPEEFAPKLRASFKNQSRLHLDIRHFEPPQDAAFPTPYYITKEAYIRFWAQDLFPDRARVLYLDSDIIVAGPLEELWSTDLQGNVLGAVEIPNSSRPAEHGMPPGSLYFNSGVLLIDLAAWRAGDYTRKCLDYLQRHPEKAHDADQDILNLVLIDHWLPLDYKWNAINPFFRPSHDLGLPRSTIDRVRAEACIIHYNGSSKPWVYLDNHPRQRDYLRHLSNTAWRDWQPADRTPVNICIKHASPFIPGWTRKGLKSLVQAVTHQGQ